MARIRQLATRQRVRAGTLLLAVLLFPLTLLYFSPYLIILGASVGVVNASPMVFALLFLSAIVVGRLWCGWACPGAGLGELAMPVQNRHLAPGWLTRVKWVIWAIWLAMIAWAAARAGGYRRVDALFQLEGGLTVEQPYWYVVYYAVMILFMGLALLFGRRAGCHTICWMAPFLILGRKLRNLLNTPALRLRADSSHCIACGQCTSACPMSLDVQALVRKGRMEHSDCVLCGSCADICPKDVIGYTFGRGR